MELGDINEHKGSVGCRGNSENDALPQFSFQPGK